MIAGSVTPAAFNVRLEPCFVSVNSKNLHFKGGFSPRQFSAHLNHLTIRRKKFVSISIRLEISKILRKEKDQKKGNLLSHLSMATI